MATREEVIYRVRMEGVPQLVADSRTAATATEKLKASARSTSVPVAAGGVAGARGLSAADQALIARMRGVQGEAAAIQGSLAAQERRLAAQLEKETAAARRRPAFGERGRAIASAAGAGRFAGLAAPFGGWGPLLGIGLGFTALNQFKAGVTNIGLNQQLSAQTAAGIKSTGGAANVTAGHIDKLAVSLGKLAGVQDETVHDSENILLTFANIRNEAGKGNKVFDLTSLAVANVASRMHTDMPQAALQLGKALNDPIKGLGALRRIGVQFNQQQVDQIKVMVASGNRLGAQKIILQELNREFGGSAKAAGKTLPAALVHLGEAWEDARNRLVIKALPAMTRATNWLAVELPGAINTTLTAFSLFDTDPRGNALSRWLHRNWGGSVTGGIFDYTLQTSGKDALKDLGRHTLTHQARINGASTGSRADLQGLAERRRQQAAVGGIMLDEEGTVVKGLGAPFTTPPVKVHWSPTDPFDSRPVILVADGQQLAKVVTKQQQKRTHAEGTGTRHR